MATRQAKAGGTAKAANDRTELDERTVIPVIEERPTIDKKVVESGRVRVAKRIREHEELIDVPLFREEVKVDRVPVNLFVEAMPAPRQEGDTMIIPVVEERVVVQKKLFLVEELRVRKEVVEHHEPQTVVLRKEEVEIERVAGREKAGDAAT